MSAILSVEAVVHRYGANPALAGIDFHLERGEMFGLIGPDGAGKTTTLRAALGLLSPTSGRVRTLGLDPWKARRVLSNQVGYLSQRFSIYGDLSIDENIGFFAEAHGVPRWRPRRDELLERLGLTPFRRRLADRLSGGMKQKVALACTLAHTPEFLVLDEPTTGVDPVSRREFWRILSELQREGLTLLITTPYLDEAERCQRVALIDEGRLLVVDRPDALRGGADGTLLEVLATPRRRAQAALASASGVADLTVFGERIHVTLHATSGEAAVRDALERAEVQVESVRAITPSLEDVFISRIPARGRLGRGAATLALLAALSVPARAQDHTAGDSLRLALSDALVRAAASSPRLAELDAARAGAAAAVREAASARWPSLSLSAGYSRLSEVPDFAVQVPGGPSFVVSENIPDPARARAEAGWVLWSGGRITSGIAAATRLRDASDVDLRAARGDLALETTTAYWALVTARESARVAREASNAFGAHLEDAERRAAVGLASRNDVLSVQVERDRAEVRLLEAENQAEVAEENLRRLLALPPEVGIAPTDPLALEPNGAEAAPDLESAVAAARIARPERAALALRLAALEARVGIERSARLPQARLSGGYDVARPNGRYVPAEDAWNDSWDLTAALSLNLFDGHRTAAAVARARADAEAMRRRLDDLDGRIRVDVVSRAKELETARRAAAVTAHARDAATENLRVNRDRYREGVLTSTELLDAEVNLLRAGLDHAAALARARVAAAALDRALGR